MPDREFAHFLEAQSPVYTDVIAELRQGRKESHWMWFVFPQLAGLGRSTMSQMFALHSLEQARRYAQHPVLGSRLRECVRLLLAASHDSAGKIFPYPDDLKFHSSLTLFALAEPAEPLFTRALAKYFNRQHDPKTLELLGPQVE